MVINRLCIFLFFTSLVFYVHPTRYLGITVTDFSNIFAVIYLIILSIIFYLDRKVVIPGNVNSLIAFSLLLIYLIMTSIFSVDVSKSFVEVLQLILVIITIVYLLRSTKDLSYLIIVIKYLGLFSSIMVFYYFIIGKSEVLYASNVDSILLGFYSHFISVSFLYYLNRLLSKPQINILLILLFEISALLIFGSRAILLSLGLGAILVGAYNKSILKISLIGCLCYLVFTFITSSILSPDHIQYQKYSLSSSETLESYNIAQRFFLWQAAIDIWKDYPILGSGFGSYSSLVDKYTMGNSFKIAKDTHNLLLTLLCEHGLLGVIAISLFLARILYRTWRSLNQQYYLYGMISLVFLIYMISVSMFSVVFSGRNYYMFILSIILCYKSISYSEVCEELN